MKLSRRAKRMQQHHKRKNDRNASLNMVSLMDIFTILVFFLLVNASSTEVLPTPKSITLPEASSEKLPERNLVIAVSDQQVTLEGVPVINTTAIQMQQPIITTLARALEQKKLQSADVADKTGVTIMGDKQIPYTLLKKIMLTCAQTGFTRLSFAVTQKAAGG